VGQPIRFAGRALTRAGTFDKVGRLSIWDTATQAQLAAVEDLSMKAFFYRPEVSFAAAADRLALWTEDYGVLGWNGERLIRRDGISKAQIGTTPWFGADSGLPLLFSSDGSRLLAQRFSAIAVFDSKSLLPISIIRMPLAAERDYYQPSASFENASGEQLRAGDFVWQLEEAGRLHAAGLRRWMCSDARRRAANFSGTFTPADRKNWYLGGRPAEVCAWMSLKTAAGSFVVHRDRPGRLRGRLVS
jgi:hypothetical protein